MENGGSLLKNDKEKINLLEELCLNNCEFFKNDKSEKGICLHDMFQEWMDYIQKSWCLVEKIQRFVHEYDFDSQTLGNGHRSFIKIVYAAADHGIRTCESIIATRDRYFFRKSFYTKEVKACKDLFSSLCTCLEYLFILREWSDKGSLFARDTCNAEELFNSGEKIDQYCFYGRCAGFQYTEPMRGILRGLSICMASYSESYFSKAGKILRTTSSAWTSNKYFWDPELRAKRIVNISHSASIDFCKSFWFLAESEIMHALPSIFGSSIEVNNIIDVPPEPIQLENVETGELVSIPIPSSHLPKKSIPARLLSSYRREGMIGVLSSSKTPLPASNSLIIHCHGGGFVAQSSKSHEMYLRDWAVSLNVPILSIDYSLAPEAPYPRALEEVFFVYCWALRNANFLGTTAQKVVFAGDSAGANLCIATIFKCIDFGLKKPDGLFMAYCPVYLSFVPSPARMLCLMDPLLPFGFMIRCMKAYACVDEKGVPAEENMNGAVGTEINNIGSNVFNFKTDNRRLSSMSNIFYDEDRSNKSALSDATSDTFASASYHSQIAENTELLTPDIASSCISFEEDSQPIMKLDTETLSNISTPSVDSENKNETAFLQEYTTVKTLSEENIVINVGKEVLSPKSLQGKLHKAAVDLVEMISSALKSLTDSSKIIEEDEYSDNREEMKNLDSLIARIPGDEFSFQVPKDPFISPYIAPDEYLRQMPPTRILTLDMDPCLDDSVMFAKRLKNAETPVKIDILQGLPHGFLNFTMLSKEANEGSKICVNRIAELLKC